MTDFDNTYSVPDDVVFPRTLEIVIDGGQQVFPAPDPALPSANTLLVFTGTLVANLRGDSGDGTRVLRGVVRLRLNRALTGNELFVGSATMAALGSIHTDEEDITFAVDDVETVLDEARELVLVANVAIQGEAASLSRIAYQANVLMRDLLPDLESILVRPAGSSAAFEPSTDVTSGDRWEYLITLSGPAPQGGILILLSSADPTVAPIAAATEIPQGAVSAAFSATATGSVQLPTDVVITALDSNHGRSTRRTATVRVRPGPR